MGDEANKDSPKRVDPSRLARDVFLGPDISVGREILGLLESEGIGVQVRSRKSNERKKSVMFDRYPGEEDFTVREKDLTENRLLGIVFPVAGSASEFVFISADEEGFVFKAGESRAKDSDPKTKTTFQLEGWARFGEFVSSSASLSKAHDLNITLREGEKSKEFEEVAVSAVSRERQRIIDNKNKRAETRNSLYKRLFGSD